MRNTRVIVRILYFGHDERAHEGFAELLNRAGYEVDAGKIAPRRLQTLDPKRYHLVLSSHPALPPSLVSSRSTRSTAKESGRPPVALTARLKTAEPQRPTSQLNLRALRGSAGKTQEYIAHATEMSQPQLSRIEARGDHLVSTLRKYVRALGGDIEVVARIRGRRVLLRDV